MKIKEWYDLINDRENECILHSDHILLKETDKPNSSVIVKLYKNGDIDIFIDGKINISSTIKCVDEEVDYSEFSFGQVIKCGYLKVPDGMTAESVLAEMKKNIFSTSETNSLEFQYCDLTVKVLTISDFCDINIRLSKNGLWPIPFKKKYTNENKYFKIIFITNVYKNINASILNAIDCINRVLKEYGEYIDDYSTRYYPLVTHDKFHTKENAE